MSPAIHQSATSDRAFLVPSPRLTDAIGEALRGAYRGGAETLPADILASLAALDRHRRT